MIFIVELIVSSDKFNRYDLIGNKIRNIYFFILGVVRLFRKSRGVLVDFVFV